MADDHSLLPLVDTLALVATLRTALKASDAIVARQCGRDPSEQEPIGRVRDELRTTVESMGSLVLRLRLRLVAGSAPGDRARLIREFNDRLALTDLAEQLRVAHQKLLSLYPTVEEELVEEVRLLGLEVRVHVEGDRSSSFLKSFLERVANALHALRMVLVERP